MFGRNKVTVIQVWEDEGGDVVIWGTDSAKLAKVAYDYWETSTGAPYDLDWEELNIGFFEQARVRYAPKYYPNVEDWDTALIRTKPKRGYVPFMVI